MTNAELQKLKIEFLAGLPDDDDDEWYGPTQKLGTDIMGLFFEFLRKKGKKV